MFMRANRRLDLGQQAFIASCFKANIGPAKGHRLYKEVVGSYANVGATAVEFQNFRRDLQVYIDTGDAEMIIGKLKKKQEECNEFVFNYHLDGENRLARLFWSDATARKSYSYFGDVLSFDATYGTNRYDLVFVPFTGVDNHRRCVTFGAGLLTKEDVESYTWLLQEFKLAMGKDPTCLVTDQDPAMKIAIEDVYAGCRHRFCMWHIMTKVSEKVGPVLAKDEAFRNKLNGIVWNVKIHRDDFEAQWQTLMAEYNLLGHRWFSRLYELKSFWIPAFFTDMPMSGLLRTTSLSEAENSAFGKFMNRHASLVEFYIQFESVVDAQRHKHAKLDADCEGYLPVLKTPLLLEKHAAREFTSTIFYEVQKEIVSGCFSCRVVGIREAGEQCTYDIKGRGNEIFTVEHWPGDNSTLCSCNLFQRMGLVCRHMFLVFKDAQVERIPAQYVAKRWSKTNNHIQSAASGSNTDGRCPLASATTLGTGQLWDSIHACVGLAGANVARLSRLEQAIKDLNNEFLTDGLVPDQEKGNNSAIEAFCGVKRPVSISIKPPVKAKNKGSGKRVKGSREKAIEQSAKPKRRCRSCNTKGWHDSRNCPSV